MTRLRIVALITVLTAFSVTACGGSSRPATDLGNGVGTNPSPYTTGPGAGEPTDSNPDPTTEAAGTNTPGTSRTAIGPTDGSNGSGPGNTAAGTGTGATTGGHDR